MSSATGRAAVLGAGSWGTALALHLATIGHDVSLWGRDRALIEATAVARVNQAYLPGVRLPEAVSPTTSLTRALAGARFVVVAVPSHGLRAVASEAAPGLETDAILVSATKGLEAGTQLRMSEVLAAESGHRLPVVALSGPSFASEVARGAPTALVAASTDASVVRLVQDEFRSPSLRLYGSDDVIGVEIGGALKNVIAIAAGAVQSLDLGPNAMAALITRGLAEISRLASAMGGRAETMAGLGGLGDLVLTCTGTLSRNHHVGIELGRGRPIGDVLGEMRMVAEGVNTTEAALALGDRHGVELPITSEVAAVLAGRKTPREALGCLMLRPQRGELEGT